jgi:hypothetical protein
MQLVEKIVYQQHETEYIYMFMCYIVCPFMKLNAAVTSCLPIVQNDLALTVVAIRTIHIRVQKCNSVLNTGMLETAVATKIIHTTVSDIV